MCKECPKPATNLWPLVRMYAILFVLGVAFCVALRWAGFPW